MGATVVMVCRDRARGEDAQREIQMKSGNDAVDLLLADLSSQQSIRQLAATFRQRYQHLHVLINNAGAGFTQRRETVDGLEMTFAVNYLAPFLLTNLLLDVLKRITLLALSGIHVWIRDGRVVCSGCIGSSAAALSPDRACMQK